MLRPTLRPIGWLLTSLLFCQPRPWAEASSHVSLKHEYFWDANEVWNHTPVLELVYALGRKWSLGYEQKLDIVSGASRRLGSASDLAKKLDASFPEATTSNGTAASSQFSGLDATSGASKVEMRHSESPALTYSHEGTVVSGSIYSSREEDYNSLAPAIALAYDFNERNTTVGLSYAEFFDEFLPKGAFAGQGGDKRIHSLGVSLTQTLTPLSLAGISLSYIKSAGYLGHPYNPPTDKIGVLMTENVPDSKVAAAVSAQWVQGFHTGETLNSLNLDLRSYADDWGLKSFTSDLMFFRYLSEFTVLRFRVRYYKQTGAAFAKIIYEGNEGYRTADIRHFPFTSMLLGVKLNSTFPESWGAIGILPNRWDIKYDFLWRDTKGDPRSFLPGQPRYSRYQSYAPDANYTQGTVMVGVSYDFH